MSQPIAQQAECFFFTKKMFFQASNIIRRLKQVLALVFATSVKLSTQSYLVASNPEITFSTLIGWRYVPFLLTALTDVGTVGVRWHDIGRAMEMLPFNRFLFCIVISDWLPVEARGVLLWDKEWGTKIQCRSHSDLTGSYYESISKRNADIFVLPYFGHPSYYIKTLDKLSKRLALQGHPKKNLLFFSGSSSPFYERLLGKFEMKNRHELLCWLKQYLDRPTSGELKEKSQIHIVWDSRDTLLKQALSQVEYIHALSESDFCLCLPGWKIPHAHSIIECLMTGCIPVTNYAHLMDPPLEHGVNCLSFSSISEFQGILESLPAFTEDKKDEMRRHVFEYGSQYLQPFAVGSRLLAAVEQGVQVIAYNDESGC